jgi:site-specific DNA recombinase
MEKVKKAIIVARVSTTRQEKEGLSLQDIQIPKLKKYAEDKGMVVVREFVFSETADRKIRKKFDEVIDFVKDNEDIVAIISYRVDRVTRNYRDAVVFDDLRLEYEKELHFVDDRLVLTNKTVGRDIQDWDLKVFLAKQHINRLKEDAINSAKAKLEKGEINGKAPYGYRNVTRDDKSKWVEIEPFEAMVVKSLYEWYSTRSYSMLELRKKLEDEFEVKHSKGMIDFILKKKFYHGIIEYDGKEYPHKYDRIIDEDLYNKVQEVKNSHNKKSFKYKGIPFLYRGLITCKECGCSITPERKKGRLVYYHCTQYHYKHDAEWLREEELTKQFSQLFKDIQVPEEQLNEITQALKESHEGKKEINETLLNEIETEDKKLDTRVERMYEDLLDQRITQSTYDKNYKRWRERQAVLRRKRMSVQRADDDYYITATYLLKLASKASILFESSEPEEKRLLLNMVVQNATLNGTIVDYDLKKPFDTILVSANSQSWLPLIDTFRTYSDVLVDIEEEVNVYV